MKVGIKNNIFCFRLSLFHRKRKKQFEYAEKKNAKALESKETPLPRSFCGAIFQPTVHAVSAFLPTS